MSEPLGRPLSELWVSMPELRVNSRGVGILSLAVSANWVSFVWVSRPLQCFSVCTAPDSLIVGNSHILKALRSFWD